MTTVFILRPRRRRGVTLGQYAVLVVAVLAAGALRTAGAGATDEPVATPAHIDCSGGTHQAVAGQRQACTSRKLKPDGAVAAPSFDTRSADATGHGSGPGWHRP